MYRARNSSLFGKITILFVICCCCLSVQGKYGGGTGEPNDPYLIYTPVQMNAIGADPCDWDKCFKLMTDIDLGGYTSFNIIGNSSTRFTGIFDGNGKTISNFTYTSTVTNYIGLFGYVSGENAEIKDLGLINPDVDAGTGSRVGSLVGQIPNGDIINCYVEGGSVAGNDVVGGLAGYSNFTTIITCHSECSVAGDDSVGGLVGVNHGTITSCSSEGDVSGNKYVGGLVGGNSAGKINNCFTKAGVSGVENVGGLVGINEKTIINCYSTGSVSGISSVGGLVGVNTYFGTITNCYSKGDVSGDEYVGGLVGENGWCHSWGSCYPGKVSHCYSTSIVSGDQYVGGLVGRNVKGDTIASFWDIETSGQTASDGGTGLPTAQMQMASTFINAGWDFENVWWILEGAGYPRLWWEGKYGGGSGHPNDPYLIYTAEQMNAIGADSRDWDKCFLLCADIDLSAFTGTSFNVIGNNEKPFTGVFDGNQHTISNFNYTPADTHGCIGLFGYIDTKNAEIKYLALIDANVNAQKESGAIGLLVGWLYKGKITNCYSTGIVSGGRFVGGLVGVNIGTMINCSSTGSVSGDDIVGGLVGDNTMSGIITNCNSSCEVSGINYVGGLVGRNDGLISNCYANGEVSGIYRVGGLSGANYHGTISNCYSEGNVSGFFSQVGGLVGHHWKGAIENCYSTRSVHGRGSGGLVGYKYEGRVTNSFWNIETSGQTSSDGGTGKTTAEMQMAITFIGWGCEPVWTIDEGKDYPRLAWENMPGELLPQLSEFLPGSGTQADPYLIYTSEQLNLIGLFPCEWNKHFLLCADIDLSIYTGTSFNIIGYFVNWDDNKPFTGSFDGSGHTISNFTYNSTGKWHIGIFGYVSGENAEIKNLGLIDPNVEAGTGEEVGSLVGWLGDGTISGCYVEGGSVSGDQYVGGLVGWNRVGTIIGCYSKGSVTGDHFVGGLVGQNSYGTITNCYATASVSGDWTVGGLVGENYGIITNCYSTGSASGTKYVGGLVGGNWFVDSTICNCYSTGSVVGDRGGGLVGYNEGTVLASFWDIETSGQTTSAGGTGLPTAQMQKQITFTDAGWDFVGETFNGIEDIWFIGQQDYPHLWWEGMQVPMKLTPRTLNCRSEGNWVKAHLTLPEGFTVADVDSNRPAVLHSFGFQSAPLYVFVNKNELVQIEATFERQAVCSLAGDWPDELTVAGFLADGNIFLGSSTVRINHPGMKVIEDLAKYWLNADCVHPDFCDGIDMNRDSLVNLPDYALLMNTNVEFVTDE